MKDEISVFSVPSVENKINYQSTEDTEGTEIICQIDHNFA